MTKALKPLKRPYKDTLNRFFTNQLFLERANPESGYKPIFTFHDKVDGYICGLDSFVELDDPTGYQWAKKYLGSFQHFEKLLESAWFKGVFTIWLKELQAKMRGEALANIAQIASSEESTPTQRLAAAKYLAERPYELADRKREGASRGRPSKEELKGHLKHLADVSEQTRQDFERIGLTVIKGNK